MYQEDDAMRVAVAITLIDEERATLTKWGRGRSTPARLVQRAEVVLLAAAGLRNGLTMECSTLKREDHAC